MTLALVTTALHAWLRHANAANCIPKATNAAWIECRLRAGIQGGGQSPSNRKDHARPLSGPTARAGFDHRLCEYCIATGLGCSRRGTRAQHIASLEAVRPWQLLAMPRRQQRALSSATAPSEPVETCHIAPAAPAPACSANRHARLRRALSSSASRVQRASQAVGHCLKPGVQHIRSWQVVPAQVRRCWCTRLCMALLQLTCALGPAVNRLSARRLHVSS